MEEERLYVLSIAGFDPSGGAGILADIKTFESNKVYGLGVCSALTFQSDNTFGGVSWVKEEEILRQLEILLQRFTVKWIKIGLIESSAALKTILRYINRHAPDCRVVWDPILKASAGFEFHREIDRNDLLEICKSLYLITPNLKEIKALVPEMNEEEGAAFLSGYCNVLLKGGHRSGDKAIDILFEKGERTIFEGDMVRLQKHGTGCVLSAAILTNLAKGYDLQEACKEGKEYVTDFINSDRSLLGFHYV